MTPWQLCSVQRTILVGSTLSTTTEGRTDSRHIGAYRRLVVSRINGFHICGADADRPVTRRRAVLRRRAFVTPNWLPVIIVVVGVIVLAMLACILGWTGMR